MALLGERIAQLFDTAPEPDPENVFDDDTIAKNERIETGIDVELNPSRIRDIDLGDSYKGMVVSRNQLNEWNNNNSNNNEDELQFNEDNDDDIDDDDIDDIDNDDDDDIDDDIHDIDDDEDEFDTLFEDENEKTAGFDIDLINNNNNKSNKHSLDRFNNKNDEFNDFKSMMNKQMDKADELQQKEEQRQDLQIISNKKQEKPQSFQLRKANAVSAQTKLYDKVATLRIHLQKPFQIAQKLPRPSVHGEIIKDIDGENDGNKKNEKRRKLKRLFDEISNEALSLTDNMMNLQSKLLNKNEEYPEELRERKRRRLNNNNNNDIDTSSNNKEFDVLWDEMNKDWNDFLPFSNKTMDIWDRKMRLIEDYKKKKDKINNQSLLERIALIIENPQRILYKMQSVDKLFKMYGDGDIMMDIDNDNNNNNDDDDDDDDNDLNKKDERIRNGMEDVSHLKFAKYRIECEVFNDGQFYRRMLKEIIDIGHAATFNAEEIHRKMDQIQHEKQKQKMAFHRAKLRMKYTIRPDMENFMAPIYNHDPDFPVEQLYNSLFQ